MAKVVGNTIDITGAGAMMPIDFVSAAKRQAPVISGSSLVSTVTKRTVRSASSGNYGPVSLAQGDYYVTFNACDQVLIRVPNNGNRYDLTTLIISEVATPGELVGLAVPTATSTVLGLVKVNTDAVMPVVYRKEEIDAILGSVISGGQLAVYNQTLGKFQQVVLVGAAGAEQLAWGAPFDGEVGAVAFVSDARLIELASKRNWTGMAYTYDDFGNAATITVKWRDGSAGVYTQTGVTAQGFCDSWEVTHESSGKKVVQAAPTRDELGRITAENEPTVEDI